MDINDQRSIAAASTMLAIIVIGIAFLLTWRQRGESQRHPEPIDELDRRYFARQGRRRYRGVLVLALLGLGIGVGGNIDIRAGKTERIAFVSTWAVVFLLLLQLLLFAFLDLWSTRRYAERQRRRLADERRQILEREIAALREASSTRERPPEGGL